MTEIQSFLGFCNFYRQFILAYSDITAPLTELTKSKDKRQFHWNGEAEAAFQKLKDVFESADILVHYNPNLPSQVVTDASDMATAGVLSQIVDGKLRPVAFHARKLNIHEQRYEIHDKELLAIIDAIKTWRHMLEGKEHQIKVLSDHQALKWFDQKRSLSRRQVRWMMFLQDYNYRIEYRPGRLAGKPDALSKRADFTLTPEDRAYNEQQVLHLNVVEIWKPDRTLLDSIRENGDSDKQYRKVQQRLQRGSNTSSKVGEEVLERLIYRAKGDRYGYLSRDRFV